MKLFTSTMKFFLLSFLLSFMSLHMLAQAPPSDLSGQDLRTWLKQNYYDGNHNQLGYDNARMYMYNYIDNHNNTITGVYSGYEVNWQYGGTGTNPAPINCEHTIPQSFFNYNEPMKSDIHHLFPTYQNWNSTRSNHPLGEIDDNTTYKWMYLDQSQTTIPSYNIDLYSEYANSEFEPREDHKGNVARAIFYFYTMYPTQAGDMSLVADINELYQWHLSDPVDADEIARNNAIETYQGDRNPYIDYPTAVADAWGFESTPSAPAAPQLSLVSGTSDLTVSWNDLSNEDGYKIYRSTGSSYSLQASLSANTTNYVDYNVVEGTTYSYYAIAYNTEGNSANSNVVSGQLSTSGGGNATDLFISEYVEGSSYNKAVEIANFTGSSVNLSNYSLFKQTNGSGAWEAELILSGTLAHGDVYVIANSNAGTTVTAAADLVTSSSFTVFNGNDPVALFKNGSLIDILGTYNSTATFASDVTLVRNSNVASPNSTYTESEWTSYAQDEFSYLGSHTFDSGAVEDTEAPTAPSGLYASNVTETTLDLYWNASSDNIGVSSYEIYQDGNYIASSTSTSYAVSGLTASTTYSFYVKAKDAAGNVSVASNNASATTDMGADTEAPTAPSGLYASNITETAMDIYWSASSDNVGVSSYEVYRNGSFLTSTSSTSYAVSGLAANTTYNFYVKAKDAAGNVSAASNTIYETTLESPSSNCYVSDLVLNITTDNYPSETTWEVKDANGQTVTSGGSYNNNNSNYSEVIALADGDYSFVIYDSYGDGICCSYGNGSYALADANNAEIVSGGDFGSSETTTFCIGGGGGTNPPEDDGSAPDNYCASYGNNSSYEWIDLVSLGSIYNSTGNDGGYADYTAQSTDVSPANQYTINYSCGFSGSSYTEYWHVYIDFNRDGDFTDNGERVAYQSSSSGGTLSSTFTVPSGASIGNTRMRVTMKYNGEATPCETGFSYGEVEDYNINITNGKSTVLSDNQLDVDMQENYSVYPNPVSSILNIETTGKEEFDVVVYNVNGQQVLQTNSLVSGGQINVGNLNNGVYMLQIRNADRVVTKRFVKK